MGGILYLATRVTVAAILLVRQWHATGAILPALGQLLSDVCAALFVVAVVDTRLNAALGSWWLPLFLYALSWEVVRFRNLYEETVDNPSTDDPTTVGALGAPLAWAWQLAGVLPPLAAGAFLVASHALSR
jgi:hypothetical protein